MVQQKKNQILGKSLLKLSKLSSLHCLLLIKNHVLENYAPGSHFLTFFIFLSLEANIHNSPSFPSSVFSALLASV